MAVAEHVGTSRRCSRCGEVKRVDVDDERASEFFVKARHKNGAPRLWHSRCKPCHRQADRERVGALSREEHLAWLRSEPKQARPTSPAQDAAREYLAMMRAHDKARREEGVDTLIELLRTKGIALIERQRTKFGLTTRLVVRRPDGEITKIAVAYKHPNRKSSNATQEAAA